MGLWATTENSTWGNRKQLENPEVTYAWQQQGKDVQLYGHTATMIKNGTIRWEGARREHDTRHSGVPGTADGFTSMTEGWVMSHCGTILGAALFF